MEAASLIYNTTMMNAKEKELILRRNDFDVITEHVANLSICQSRSLPSIDEYFKGKNFFLILFIKKSFFISKTAIILSNKMIIFFYKNVMV